jgi:hypothetical protein
MAKRFTDNQKWEDSWFMDLTTEQKLIWIYLLDHCDNAGLWKINIKNLNYFCSTNISVEELLSIFKNRLVKLNSEICIIVKFCIFQYGIDFLNSKNKAVIAAINKLISVGVVKENNNTYTLSIPYQYPIDTPKEKEEDKEEVKDKDKLKDKDKEKVKDEVKELEKLILIETIKEKIENDWLKNVIINWVNGDVLTSFQRNNMFAYRDELIKEIPILEKYI